MTSSEEGCRLSQGNKCDVRDAEGGYAEGGDEGGDEGDAGDAEGGMWWKLSTPFRFIYFHIVRLRFNNFHFAPFRFLILFLRVIIIFYSIFRVVFFQTLFRSWKLKLPN